VCPVLTVTEKSKDVIGSDPKIKFHEILVATDFLPCSNYALAAALAWAHKFNSKLTLLHCVDKKPPQGLIDIFPEYNPCFERQLAHAWERLECLVPEEGRRNISLNCEVRYGDPKQEILRVAGERNADLIVTGAHGTGKLSSSWGSVSSSVVRNGHVPVMVVNSLANP
jgi:universal stress protein A